jgi:ParB family chromosome partitioning protein
MVETVAISAITVGDRHRKAMGNLTALAGSIAGVGLIHPIVVTPDMLLVAGQRRLEACKQLGWTEIPVYVVHDLGAANKLLEAERDENVCRLEMTVIEKVRLGLALNELEKPKAEGRQHEGQTRGAQAKKLDRKLRSSSPRRDKSGARATIVGNALGMSASTWERARLVVTHADAGDERAIEARAMLEKNGRVTPAYEHATGKKISTGKQSPRSAREKLRNALTPLRRYLHEWDEAQLHGVTPSEARRLLATIQEIDAVLLEVERALEARTIVSRALR